MPYSGQRETHHAGGLNYADRRTHRPHTESKDDCYYVARKTDLLVCRRLEPIVNDVTMQLDRSSKCFAIFVYLNLSKSRLRNKVDGATNVLKVFNGAKCHLPVVRKQSHISIDQ